MPQFLQLVWQHVLGVVGNVIYCFVANLTEFPAINNCENRLRFDEIIVKIGWRVFETECMSYRGRYFTGQMTQPTVKALKEDKVLRIRLLSHQVYIPPCYNNTTYMQHEKINTVHKHKHMHHLHIELFVRTPNWSAAART